MEDRKYQIDHIEDIKRQLSSNKNVLAQLPTGGGKTVEFAKISDWYINTFSKSVMIGNTLSDMQFGRNLGIAINIFLPTTRPNVDLKDPAIDLVYNSLKEVAGAVIH